MGISNGNSRKVSQICYTVPGPFIALQLAACLLCVLCAPLKGVLKGIFAVKDMVFEVRRGDERSRFRYSGSQRRLRAFKEIKLKSNTWKFLLSAGLACLWAAGAIADDESIKAKKPTLITEHITIVSDTPGIELYIRNKRPQEIALRKTKYSIKSYLNLLQSCVYCCCFYHTLSQKILWNV